MIPPIRHAANGSSIIAVLGIVITVKKIVCDITLTTVLIKNFLDNYAFISYK